MRIDIISAISIIFDDLNDLNDLNNFDDFDDFDILIFQDVAINDFFNSHILNEFLFLIHSKKYIKFF
jgi:hypothetical protein